jgi:hypothetical protein
MPDSDPRDHVSGADLAFHVISLALEQGADRRVKITFALHCEDLCRQAAVASF